MEALSYTKEQAQEVKLHDEAMTKKLNLELNAQEGLELEPDNDLNTEGRSQYIKKEVTSRQIKSLELNLPAPKPFLEEAGKAPKVPWAAWIKQYVSYANACGIQEPSRAVQVLKYLLGFEGQRILETLQGPKEGVEDIDKLMSLHYNPHRTSQYWRNLFHLREQTPHKSVQEFGLILNELISMCEFGLSLRNRS